MANIHSVRLENFQSHLDTYLEFDAGLNVLVGQSDSGKTAILRGIRWALYNQPRGSDFIRVGADFVRVTVRFDHGTTIIRERTSSKNRYTIQKTGEEDLILEGFGIHVPEEVLEAHGMGAMRIDHDHELMLHLSQQLDGPFLLEQTNTVRAKALGRISGAHFLDMAIRDTSKDLSQLRQQLKQEEQLIEKLEGELQPYQSLPAKKEQLDQTEQRMQAIKAKLQKKEQLERLRQQQQRLQLEQEAVSKRLELVKPVEHWQQAWQVLSSSRQQLVQFQHLQARWQEVRKASKVCRVWIEKTANVQQAGEKHGIVLGEVERLHSLKKLNQLFQRLRQEEEQELRKVKQTAFSSEVDEATIERIAGRQQRLAQLQRLRQQVTAYETQQKKLSELLDTLPQLDSITGRQEAVVEQHLRLEQLRQLHGRLKECSERIKEGRRFIASQQAEEEQAEERWREHLLEVGTCPTCGQAICSHTKSE